MVKFIRKHNRVLTKKIEVDTIAGILLSVIMVSMFYLKGGLDVPTIQNVFIVVTISIVLINVIVDILDLEGKYFLMDSILFIGLLIWFGSVLQSVVEFNSVFLSEVEGTIVVHSRPLQTDLGFYYSINNLDTFLFNFRFYAFFVLAFYSLWGFFTRYDSRIKQNHKRTSIFGLLENVTKASTADVSRSSGLTAAGRTQLIQDTLLGEEFAERLEENQKIEEHKNKRDK